MVLSTTAFLGLSSAGEQKIITVSYGGDKNLWFWSELLTAHQYLRLLFFFIQNALEPKGKTIPAIHETHTESLLILKS